MISQKNAMDTPDSCSRRELLTTIAGAIASYSLFSSLFTVRGFARTVEEATDHWVKRLNEMSRDLKKGGISPAEWQDQLAALYNYISPEEITAFIDFDRLVKGFQYPDLGVNTKGISFPKLQGVPKDVAFAKKLFGMKKDRAIIPHGHHNMVSCHFVLQGEVHVRHYDKVAEDQTHMEIAPTIDLIGKPGSFSSISDERNNVHWIKALTPTAFTFDVIITDLQGKKWNVENIDPYNAEALGNGNLRAKKLSLEDALKKYGHDMHH